MVETNYVFVCRSSLDLIRLVPDVEWMPSFTSIRRWKKMKYCPFTKRLNVNKHICSRSERIFEFVLTLDGLILAWKYEEVDTNRERETLLKWYKGPSIIQRIGW